MSLNKKSIDTSKSNTLPPTKPQRSPGVYQHQAEGNENLFKFDLNIERGELKINKASNEFKEDNEASKSHQTVKLKRKKEKKRDKEAPTEDQLNVKTSHQYDKDLGLQEKYRKDDHKHKINDRVFNESVKTYVDNVVHSDSDRHFFAYSDDDKEEEEASVPLPVVQRQ